MDAMPQLLCRASGGGRRGHREERGDEKAKHRAAAVDACTRAKRQFHDFSLPTGARVCAPEVTGGDAHCIAGLNSGSRELTCVGAAPLPLRPASSPQTLS